jgi:hypothetical protein
VLAGILSACLLWRSPPLFAPLHPRSACSSLCGQAQAAAIAHPCLALAFISHRSRPPFFLFFSCSPLFTSTRRPKIPRHRSSSAQFLLVVASDYSCVPPEPACLASHRLTQPRVPFQSRQTAITAEHHLDVARALQRSSCPLACRCASLWVWNAHPPFSFD